MKSKLLLSISIIFQLFFPNVNFGQAPDIVTQPINQAVCEGTSVSFSVSATGTALTYQWRKGSVDLIDGGNISGANTTVLTINPVSVADASSDYNVIVSGNIAPNDTSANAVLDVNTPPVITSQPSSQTICAGDTVRFSVVATGFDLTYQWRKGTTDLISGGNILDATAATLVIYPTTITDTSSFYNVVVSGGCPPGDTSVKVSLLINTAPTITMQPTNQTICTGTSASFSVGATGTGLTYQWRKGNVNLSNGINISGVNTPVLTINPVTVLDTASDYNVVISGVCPLNDTSVYVYLRFNETNITTQPISLIVCPGSSASFSVATTGLTYQWMNGTTILINGGDFSGVNTPTLTINTANLSDTSSFYNVIVTGGCMLLDTSIKVSLMLNTAPAITTQPISQTVCVGSPVSFSVAASGTGLNYQWMNGTTTLTNGGDFSGVNTPTLTINPTSFSDTSSFYHVVITGSCTPNDTSVKVSLMLNTAPSITTQPVSQTVCAGTPVSFSVSATGTGLTYQWMNGTTNLANGGNLSGVNTPTLTINPANLSDTSSFYHVIIIGSCTPNDTSVKVSLMLNTAPGITTQPVSQTVCLGSSTSFSVNATGTGLSYQWMNGTTILTNGGNFSGVNTPVLTISPANLSDTSSFYDVIITGNCGLKDSSIKVSLKLNTAPGITTQPISQTVCAGSSVSFSVAATGTGLIYHWMNGSTILANGGNISGANTAMLTINPTSLSDSSSIYNVVVSGMCTPNDTSLKVSLMINTAPSIITPATSQTVCAGSPVSFSVAAIGTGISYQWMNGTTILANSGNFSGVNTSILTINPANISDTSSFYHVVIAGSCAPNDTSLRVSLMLNTAPSIITQVSSQTVCAGSPVSFSVAATGTGLTYQWRKGTVNLVNGGTISGANTAMLTINPTNLSDTSSFYNVVVSGMCTPNDTSIKALLSVIAIPVANVSSNSPVCVGSIITLSASIISGASYSWTGPNGFTSASQNPIISSATLADAGTYSLTVSTNGCSSDPVTAVVINGCGNADLNVIKTVNNAYPIIGKTVIFTITASNNGPNNATGVIVTDILQDGYTYVSSTSSIGSYNPSTGIWTIGTVNNGASAVLTITVTVVAGGNYVNNAIISGNEADGNMANNVSSVTTYPAEFFIPQGFSPNADGINDLYVIRGIEYYPSNTFTVFNRWGDKVFGTNPYQNTWDGKSTTGVRVGGDELPVGTYFYVLDLGDGSTVYKGTIYLNK
jgi:trimeric autotransporter adhesin